MIRALLLSASLLSPANGIKAGFTLLPGNNGAAPQTTAPADNTMAPIASPLAVTNPAAIKPLSLPPQNMVMAAPVTKPYAPTPEFTPVMVPAAPTTTSVPMLQEKRVSTSTTSSTVRPLGDTKANAVMGFGKRVPLVIALNELAPAGSQQAFGKNVNPQMPIDWQAGQDWLTTLNQSLAPSGLKASYSNQTVFVESAQAHVVNAAMDGSSGLVQLAPASPQPVNIYNTPQPSNPATTPPQTAPVVASNINSSSTIYNQNAGRDIPNPDNSVILSQNGNGNLPILDPIAQLPPPESAGSTNYVPAPTVTTTRAVMPANTPMVTTTTQSFETTTQTTPVISNNANAPMPLAPMPLTQPANTQMNLMASMPGTVAVAPMAASNSQWTASKGTTLRHVLEEWTSRNGAELIWNTEYDFPVQASVNISGSFEEAVRTLLRGFNQATPQPVAIMHKATGENSSVLVVTARGNDYGGSDN